MPWMSDEERGWIPEGVEFSSLTIVRTGSTRFGGLIRLNSEALIDRHVKSVTNLSFSFSRLEVKETRLLFTWRALLLLRCTH